MRMWLDDIRDPERIHYLKGDGIVIKGPWVWVKTADEAIELLKAGQVTFASLDHDLDIHATIGMTPLEKTGYDVVCWMEENNIWPVDGVQVHSMNPMGKQRMLQVVRKAYGRNY